MKAIINNPYRIAGLLVGASAMQQNRHLTRIPNFLEAGVEIPKEFIEFSFSAFGEMNLTLKTVTEAASKLNLNSDKMNAALFWFYNGNAITDEPAFDALKEGKFVDAVNIWGNLVHGKEITERNASAYFNWANLFLFSAFYRENPRLDQLEKGISLKLKFLESDFFKSFKTLATDDTYKTTKKELQLLFLSQVQTEIEKRDGITSNVLIDVLTKQDFSAKEDFLAGFVQKLIDQIEKNVDEAKTKREANNAKGADIGNTLIKQSEENLSQIKSILGLSNIKYTSISEKVAREALRCSIDYFSHFQQSESDLFYLEPALLLARAAQNIAFDSITKNKIKDNIKTLESIKDDVLFQAIEFLQSVKEAYEENENVINQHVRELEANDFDIRSGRKTIDHTAVKKRIRDSINWKKVNDSLVSLLTDNNLKIIRESDKTEQKKEFVKLMTWLKDTSQEKDPIFTIINKYREIPPNLPFKIISSEILNTDKNNNPLLVTTPMYKKYTRYIGLKLQVECFETSYVTFNVVFTEKFNYLSSIRLNFDLLESFRNESNKKQDTIEFTRTLKIDPNTKYINLSGMGNDNVCTFSINEHYIHVYVEDFLLHTKKFELTIAPSEWHEMDLEREENALKKIHETQFFQSELNVLKDQLELIKAWKFGRSLSDKESQLAEQRRKIKLLEAQAEKEKEIHLRDQLALINKLKIKIQQEPY